VDGDDHMTDSKTESDECLSDEITFSLDITTSEEEGKEGKSVETSHGLFKFLLFIVRFFSFLI
jgi:hypothetical protein